MVRVKRGDFVKDVKGRPDVVRTFSSLPGMNIKKAEAMYDAGYRTLEEVAGTSREELMEIPYIGERMAQRIKEYLKKKGITPKTPQFKRDSVSSTKDGRDSLSVSGHMENIASVNRMLSSGSREGVKLRQSVIGGTGTSRGVQPTFRYANPTELRSGGKEGAKINNVREKARFFSALLKKGGPPSSVSISVQPSSYPYSSASSREPGMARMAAGPDSGGPESNAPPNSVVDKAGSDMSDMELILEAKGIGRKKLQSLMKAGYLSLEDLRKATFEELKTVPGVGCNGARAILFFLKKMGNAPLHRKKGGKR